MLVVDASVVVVALGDDGEDGERFRERLRGEALAAPELIDVEVLSAWRRFISDEARATAAIEDLKNLWIQRLSVRNLLARCWELRDNVTTYDAAYVALAEVLGVTLLTADSRLSRASGIRCPVELIS